jgi:hypothetical protein
MRSVVASLLELLGMVAFIAGAVVTFGPGVGLMVAGVFLVVLGVVSA